MKLKTILYPILSVVIAMTISAVIMAVVRTGFPDVINMEWGWGVLTIVGVTIVLMLLSGLLSMPTLFFARRLKEGSVSRRVALNLPALIYFIGAVYCFVAIFAVESSFGVSQWIEATLAAVGILTFSLRVSFLPIIVITSNRQ